MSISEYATILKNRIVELKENNKSIAIVSRITGERKLFPKGYNVEPIEWMFKCVDWMLEDAMAYSDENDIINYSEIYVTEEEDTNEEV